MKRNFLIILFALASCSGILAQRPVGDTLWPPVDTDYFYAKQLDWFYKIPDDFDTHWKTLSFDQFLFRQEISDQMHRLSLWDGNHIAGNELYAEYPIKVVGIAICAYMEQPRDTTVTAFMHEYRHHVLNNRRDNATSIYFFPTVDDTTIKGRLTDSVILYRPRTTTDGPDLEKLAAAPWRMEQPHRNIHMPPHFTDHWDGWFIFDSIICPLYEVMFDSAVVLDGSFVVASTAFNNEGDWFPRTVLGYTENMWLWEHPATRFYTTVGNPNIPLDSCWSWLKYRQQEWRRFEGSGFYEPIAAYPFFPIIESGFDTTLCHEVSNLRVAERGAGSATLMWDAGDGGPWIVAYGKADDNWEDFTFDTVGSPMVTLTGLEVGTQYFALVRGYCSVTDEYGEWTSPLEVEIFQPGHEEPEGIEHPGDLGRFTRLVPNPARGEVNVVSSFRLSRIELYSLDGRKVVEQEADGISTVVDVSSLPSGTYIAALYLPHGVATKKLVVEN